MKVFITFFNMSFLTGTQIYSISNVLLQWRWKYILRHTEYKVFSTCVYKYIAKIFNLFIETSLFRLKHLNVFSAIKIEINLIIL